MKILLTFFFLFLFSNAWAQQQSSDSSNVGNRGAQSLNPDISAIIDGDIGAWGRRPLTLSGDDPDFGSASNGNGGGFAVQEAEVGFQGVIDPYLRGDVFLTIPNLGNLEVEEAFVTTTELPYDLQIRAGIFRSAIGRQNSQHLHIQDFSFRPLINQSFLGIDGLRSPGAEINWLAPLPFYSLVIVEGFSVKKPDDLSGSTIQSFGGGGKNDLTAVVAWENFFPLSESTSLYTGLNYAQGRSATQQDPSGTFYATGNNLQTNVFGIDLYLKYKPANYSQGFHSLSWQTEYFQRHLNGDSTVGAQNDGGLYSQVVDQLSQRWFLGVRWDYLGLPTSQFVKAVSRYSSSLTFAMSEFSRVRLMLSDEVTNPSDYPSATVSPGSDFIGLIQYEVSMGAHGAHPF